MSGFDLAQLDTLKKSQTGVGMEIINPRTRTPIRDADGNIITITLLGRSSDVFQVTTRRLSEARNAKTARGIVSTPEDTERENIETLTACTVEWSPGLVIDGAPYPYSAENARRLWADPRWRWLAEAALRFVMDDGNFLAS